MIAGNFIAELFPLKFRKLIEGSMYIRHIFGILTVLIFIILDSHVNFITSILDTLKLYAFILLLINNYNITLILTVMLLGLYYVLDEKKILFELHDNEEKNKKINNFIKNTLELLIYIITIVGFVSYYGNVRKNISSSGKKLNLLKFIFDDEKYNKLPLGFFESLKYAILNR
tara:strand:- start:1973 stop:2488 length:516 start_codon:yes stop_codon:yes gene_type:complete